MIIESSYHFYSFRNLRSFFLFIFLHEKYSCISYFHFSLFQDTANKKLCDAEKKIVGLENLLKARESISYFEKLYFPIWLSQLECSRQLKWIICFKFNLSVYARVLQSRISTNPLSPDDMAKTIVKVYGEASEVCHLDVKGDIVFTDQHWEELFLKFNLQMEDERRFIRSLFSPVTSADKRSMELQLQHYYSKNVKI